MFPEGQIWKKVPPMPMQVKSIVELLQGEATNASAVGKRCDFGADPFELKIARELPIKIRHPGYVTHPKFAPAIQQHSLEGKPNE
jgi:hypothetical protein